MLRPFSRFCVMIGAIPRSIIESLSYEKQLIMLIKWLREVVIPAIDGNTTAIRAIEEWIENVDLQEFIDVKLDEMVESGELQEIISEYLNSTAVFGFDTVSDMVSATNLINGSFARTCGKNTFNDGKGALYKIRTVTNEDVVDGDKIIAMDDESLVAVRIFDNIVNEKVLIIGDSFIAEYPSNNWGLKLVNLMGLSSDDYTILGEGGAGIYNVGNQDTNFLGLLQANIGNIDNKKLYTKIIIGGGYNDGNATSIDMILTPMESLINYCKQQFPNAKIYLSCFGWNMKYDGTLFRNRINSYVIPAYKQASKFGAYYLDNTEFCYRDMNLYESTDPVNESVVHPNDDGEREIAQAIYDALTTGYTPRYKSSNIAFDASTTDDITAASMYFTHAVTPFGHVVNLNGNFTLSKTYNPANGLTLDLGLMPDKLLRRSSDNYNHMCKVIGRVYTTTSATIYVEVTLNYNTSGHIIANIPRGLTSASVDLTSMVIVDTVYFDKYIW